MKILYIAPDRGAAALAARALREIAPDALTWAPTPASALEWLQRNRDAAAAIVEVQAQSCGPFVDQLRGLGLSTPVVVVAGSAQLESAVAAVNAGAAGYVAAGPSLESDLPRVVALAVGRERGRREVLQQTVTELETARDRAGQRLARAEEARQEAERRGASELAAAAKQLADVQALHTASLAREARICAALQQRLLELESALRNADERRASDAVAFADQLARRHAEFTASLTHAAEARDTLAGQLSAATAALDEAQHARKAEASAAIERLRRREAELDAAVAEAVAARITVENALAEAEAAHRDARQRAEGDLAAANERQAALEDLLAQETDRRTNLDRKLAASEAARQESDRRQAAELTRAAARLADLQSRYDAAQAENAAAAGVQARRVEELGAQLAEAAAAKNTLETAFAEARCAHQLAVECAAAELASAAEREAALHDRLAREADRAGILEQQLADAERRVAGLSSEAARGRRRFLQVASAYRKRVGEQRARLEAELAVARADAEGERRAKDDGIRQIEQDRQEYERARSASESELQRVAAEHDQLRQSFDRLQSAFQTLEQIAGAHAAERARLESVVANRDRALSEQAEHYRADADAAQDALARLQETLHETNEAHAAEAERLQRACDALRREVDATRIHAEALRGEAERVPVLQAQLERSERERRGDFERAPYAVCRCTESGVIVDANHSFVALLGCRRVDELRNRDLKAVVDPADDLDWLLEQARTARKTEPVETVWKTRDGRERIVRLRASANVAGSVEIVATDVTDVRAVEERVRKAQRMEAVGRLASEVAATCDALLRDAIRGAQEWLAAGGGDAGARGEGERLLADVTRAAGFLRQLEVYGNEQVQALEPVSVQRVLSDLAPVLKRVVGDDIELVLSKSSGAFDVDVEAGRLERVLVNVVGYARQRMPGGGLVRVDLASATVGRRLVSSHPHVRPGHSVLITVTGLARDGETLDGTAPSTSSPKPGVELAALVDLVAPCGGHLWMEAQPAGNMTVKIHLPKPGAAVGAAASDARVDRGGRLARWFRSGSTPAGVGG